MQVLKNRGYEMAEMIGKGATAQVYCVKHIKSGKDYACKVSEELELAEMESELMRELEHPLFPKWREFFKAGGNSYLIMEYIKGKTLEEILRSGHNIPQEDALSIGIELAEGLEYLHNRNPQMIFRDVKPLNIIIQENGMIRLVDLGAACPVSHRFPDRTKPLKFNIAGSIGYAAPEQLKNGAQAQIGWDIYAMGKVLHFMLTGRNPGILPFGAMPVRSYEPKVSLGIELLVKNCMQEKPKKRPASMREVINRLMEYENLTKKEYFRAELRTIKRKITRKSVRIDKDIQKSDYNTIDFPF